MNRETFYIQILPFPSKIKGNGTHRRLHNQGGLRMSEPTQTNEPIPNDADGRGNGPDILKLPTPYRHNGSLTALEIRRLQQKPNGMMSPGGRQTTT